MINSLIDKICGRYSVSPKHLVEPGPTPDEIRDMTRAACAAPDHGRLSPTRFHFVSKDARHRLAKVFVEAALDANPNADENTLDAARTRAMHAPCLIAVTAIIRDDNPQVPEYEQWIAVGAALQNLLLAAMSLGYHAKIVSGARVRSTPMRNAFKLETGEHLIGFVAIGSFDGEPRKLPRRTPDEILSLWSID